MHIPDLHDIHDQYGGALRPDCEHRAMLAPEHQVLGSHVDAWPCMA